MHGLVTDGTRIFYLLSPPFVTHIGQKFTISLKQVMAQFYLLTGQNQSISSQTMHFLFWSHKPMPIYRRILSRLFTHICNTLLIKNSSSIRYAVGDNVQTGLKELKYMS